MKKRVFYEFNKKHKKHEKNIMIYLHSLIVT